MKHAARAHAKLFSPSKSDSWIDCTASPSFVDSLNIPDRRTAAADEGEGAHELLDQSLKKTKHPRAYLNKKMGKDILVTPEMVDFIGYVWAWVQGKVADGYTLRAERRLNIAVIGDSGTVDVTLWNPQSKHLIVMDLKYGRGYEVSPIKNRQMRLYACGTCDEDNLWEQMRSLTLVIWQPRILTEPQEWEDTPTGLRHFRNKVAEIVQIIKAGKGIFVPSEKSCQWCPAKAQCNSFASFAAKSANLELGQLLDKAGIDTPSCDALTIDQMVNIFRNSGALESYLKSVASHLWNLLLEGKKVPGMKLVEGKSNRRWINEGDTMEALFRLGFEPDHYAPRSIVGLKDCERLFKDKDARSEFMFKHTIKPKGQATLATEDDPRPAFVSDEFASLNTKETL